ncbi:MAG: helix-turn-helix transcriptional regulator [Methyloceanibacter sp.]
MKRESLINYKATGLRLAELRRKYRYSENQAADRAGITARTWRKMERGESQFTTGTFLKICRAFNCSCDWLACR